MRSFQSQYRSAGLLDDFGVSSDIPSSATTSSALYRMLLLNVCRMYVLPTDVLSKGVKTQFVLRPNEIFLWCKLGGCSNTCAGSANTV